MGKLADYDPTAMVEMNRRTLQLRKYAAQYAIGQTSLESIEFDHREDFLTKMLIERMSLDVLSDKIVDDTYKARYTYKVFSSPWQHFKSLYMPVWFKKRYPVKKTSKSGSVTVKFTRYAEYPKANISLQRDRKTFEVMLGGYERIFDHVEQLNGY